MLDFSKTDFSQADDVGGHELAPHGTLVMLLIKEVGATIPNVNQKKYFPVRFEVAEGKYAGKELSENFYLEGKAEPGKKSYAVQKTEMFVRYVLETTLQAHTKGGDAYKIAEPKALETGRVVSRLKQEGFYGKDGDWVVVNKIDTFGTPRPDSTNYKLYEAYINKQQPWQDLDFKPLEPNNPRARGGNASYEHATADYGDPIGF